MQTEAARPAQPLPLWACALGGVVAAFVGLLPWVITGLRLPVQNLWATDTVPGQLPRVLLPFSQHAIVSIIGLLVTGAALGGLRARAAGRRLPRRGALATGVGVVLVQVVAIGQTALTVQTGLRPGRPSAVYLGALLAVAALALLVGAGALALVSSAPRGGAVVGLSIGALALGPWLEGFLVPVGTFSLSPAAEILLRVVGWAPPVLVGVAIGWGGVLTVGRVLAAGLGLLLIWLVQGIVIAVANTAGSTVLAHHPHEMAANAVGIFVAASTDPVLVLRPLAVAVSAALVAGVVIFVGRAATRRGVTSSELLTGAERGRP